MATLITQLVCIILEARTNLIMPTAMLLAHQSQLDVVTNFLTISIMI